jgi:spermidine synthase
MSATETIPEPINAAIPQALTRSFVAGVAITSFAALLLELGLTRIFSVVLFYHFAFLAISIALLGLGSGGVFAHLLKSWLKRFETRRLLALLSLVNAIAVPIVLEIVLHVPVSLEISRDNFLRLTAMYLASAVPFFVTGLEFSVLFAREPDHVPRLYGADLVGGSLACLAIVPLLNWLGGPNALVFSALMSAVAAVIWADLAFLKKTAAGVAMVLVLLLGGNYSGKLIDVVYAKGKFRDPSWVEFARWNAISRIEVDRQSEAKVVVIDADASTYIMNADPARWQNSDWQSALMSAPPALANVLRPAGSYAIIGPGGGVDVLRAVANGSPDVTGVEINPIIANTVMRGRYADYSYHLYQRPEVHIHVTDGRSFVRNARRNFDVVQMTLVDTWASTAAGAFALSENSLYTVEAFREYFEHLNPDGMIAITRWEFRQPREALRVVAVAMEALHQLGISNPARNFIVISEGELDEDGIPVAVLAKKSAFTAEEEQAVKAHLTKYPSLAALYLPSQVLGNPFASLIASNDSYGFARRYPYNVAPVYDNAPFFFFTLRLDQVLHVDGFDQGIDWKVNLGVAVLAMVLLISLGAVLLFLIVPLALGRARRSRSVTSLLYFIATGLGYILVEIAFIQRFVLFLGHPTYALTVVVFLMLLSSGLGSMASRRWCSEWQRVWIPLVLIGCALLVYVLALPAILNTLIGSPFAAKLGISALLLVPLGFAMGMPFPTGLRALAEIGNSPPGARSDSRENTIEWAWAMNAGSSVLGSVLAMVIAIQFGLNATLACGAAAYFAAILLSRSLVPLPYLVSNRA